MHWVYLPCASGLCLCPSQMHPENLNTFHRVLHPWSISPTRIWGSRGLCSHDYYMPLGTTFLYIPRRVSRNMGNVIFTPHHLCVTLAVMPSPSFESSKFFAGFDPKGTTLFYTSWWSRQGLLVTINHAKKGSPSTSLIWSVNAKSQGWLWCIAPNND